MPFRFLVLSIILTLSACGGGSSSSQPPQPPVNHAPTAQNGSNSVAYSKTVSGTLQASDQDAGTTLTYSIVSQPSTGTLTLTGNSYTYVNQNETEPDINDSFTFKVNDGKLDSNIGTVSIVTEGKENARWRDRDSMIKAKNDSRAIILAEDPTMIGEYFVGIDLENDGDEDVVVGRQNHDAPTDPASPFGRHKGKITIFRNLGLGNGFSYEILSNYVAHARNIHVADYNLDGRQDIFWGDHGLDNAPYAEMIGTQSQLFFQTQSGGLEEVTATHLPQELMFTHSACGGDINNDGAPDLVYGGLKADEVQLYINNGTGVFTKKTDGLPNLNQITTSCIVTDVDNDGKNDLIFGTLNNEYTTQRDNLLFKNSGNATFSNSPTHLLISDNPTYTAALSIDYADISADGCDDILVMTTDRYLDDSKWWVDVYNGNCDGTYSVTPNKIPYKKGIHYMKANTDDPNNPYLIGWKFNPLFVKKVNGVWTPEIVTMTKDKLSIFKVHQWINEY